MATGARQNRAQGRAQGANALWLALICAASLASGLMACGLGSFPSTPAETLRALLEAAGLATGQPVDPALSVVVVDIRLARVALAWLTGAALATAGCVFQGVLRNPLADAFTLGVSGGAAFGASVAILTGLAGQAIFVGLAGGTGILPLFALAGALLLLYVSESGLRLGLGLLLLAYGLWGLCSRRLQRRDAHAVWGMLAGFLSTSFGTAYGINGPPLAVYLSFRGGSQNETKAALGVFFIVSGLFVVAAQALAGAHSLQAVMLFATALPAVLLGGWAGMRLSAGVNDANFHAALHIMLLLMGANMVRMALS